MNGVRSRATLRRENGEVVLQVHLNGPAPDLAGGVRLALFDPPVSWVIVSLLHAAYLRLVWHLGYEYVLEPSVQGVRQDL